MRLTALRYATLVCAVVLGAPGQPAAAQEKAAAPASDLSRQHDTGRRVFAQSCGVCHLPPVLGARTYGPRLDKDAGGGDDDVMREFITNGTPRMPAFKYYLKPDEIEAIISYVRTVPVGAAGAAPARAGGAE